MPTAPATARPRAGWSTWPGDRAAAGAVRARQDPLGIHEAADGWLYFATYWGKHREVEAAFGPDYQGSLLLRYPPETGRVEDLGAIVPRHGLPASSFDRAARAAALPRGLRRRHRRLRRERRTLGSGAAPEAKQGDRTFLADARGRVYFSASTARCASTTGRQCPGLHPGAAARGARRREGGRAAGGRRAGPRRPALRDDRRRRLFAFDPATEAIADLGPTSPPATTRRHGPEPRRSILYFAPGAHGSGVRSGSPVVQYEVATGRRKVIAFLNDRSARPCATTSAAPTTSRSTTPAPVVLHVQRGAAGRCGRPEAGRASACPASSYGDPGGGAVARVRAGPRPTPRTAIGCQAPPPLGQVVRPDGLTSGATGRPQPVSPADRTTGATSGAWPDPDGRVAVDPWHPNFPADRPRSPCRRDAADGNVML
jgi:hypothetical protein